MLRGLYTAASGMLAELRQAEVVANNLANVDTPGFKRDAVMLEAFPSMFLQRINDGASAGAGGAAPAVGVLGTGVRPAASYPDFAAAPYRATGAPLDLAIEGPGFFVVQTPQGLYYTRRGDFHLTGDGTLVTTEGYTVLGEGGPIKVDDGQPTIGPHGTVLAGEREAGRLRLVEFDAPAGLQKAGESLFSATTESGEGRAAAGTAVRQGYLELSNASPVREMVDLIAVFRAYEAAQRAVQSLDQALGRATGDLGRA